MNITAIDSVPDLFFVENVVDLDLIKDINKEDLWSYPWEIQAQQNGWKRRKLLIPESSPLNEVNNLIMKTVSLIETTANIVLEHHRTHTIFWLDYEGFCVDIHEDGDDRGYTPTLALQTYLTESSDNLGTTFYHDKFGKSVRFEVPYKINSGYLLLNHPGQWHGMPNSVPKGHLRLSAYTYFSDFNHK